MDAKWKLTIGIVAGLVLGVVVGQLLHDPLFTIAMSDTEHAHPTVMALAHFVGSTVFLGLLKMLILPLIFTSVIVGVTSVGDFRKLGRVGGYTLLYYFATMAVAATLGLVVVSAARPGDAMRAEQVQLEKAKETFAAKKSVKTNIEKGPSGVMGAMKNLGGQIIPTNVVKAAAEGKTLPIIFFAIMFGITLTTMGAKGQILIDVNQGVFDAIMKLIHFVIWLTPVGVFALLVWTVARIGLGTFTEAIGGYMLTVTMGLGLHCFVVLPAVCWFFAGRQNPFRFMHQMRQALMTALGTDSSSATLPVTMECAKEAGISDRSAGFVLPLGATINMDGTALYEAVAVVFLAQAYGVDLGMSELVIVAVTATLAAIGAAGIPSAGLVTMVIVINAVNGSLGAMNGKQIPVEAIGLILGVDRFLDMMRTTVNVWGDAVGAKIVDYQANNKTPVEVTPAVSAPEPAAAEATEASPEGEAEGSA